MVKFYWKLLSNEPKISKKSHCGLRIYKLAFRLWKCLAIFLNRTSCLGKLARNVLQFTVLSTIHFISSLWSVVGTFAIVVSHNCFDYKSGKMVSLSRLVNPGLRRSALTTKMFETQRHLWKMRNIKVIVLNWSLLQNEYVTRSLNFISPRNNLSKPFLTEITTPEAHFCFNSRFFSDGQIQRLTHIENRLVCA